MTPAGWISKKLWELTYWDKRFNGVDKSKQKKILPFKHVSAEKLKSICVRGGKIKLLATGKFDGYTTKDLAQDDVNCGEVLTLPSGGTAAIKYFNGTFVDSGNIIAQTSDAEQYCLKFIYYYLMCINNVIAKEYRGTSIKHPYMPAILELSIPVPSLSEQQQIVEKLDALFADIEKEKQIAQQNLQNAKELFESELNKLFTENTGWEHKKLSEVAIDFGRGKSKHRPRNDKCLYGGPYPFIQTGDIRNSKHYITSYTQTYNETGLAQSKLWPKGTLCITIAANIAETGILDFDACFPDSVIGCTFDNNKTNAYFVEYLLQSFKSVLQAKGKGSAQDNINLGTFENQFFPFPEKSVQDRIVQKLDTLREQIQELEQIYTQQIADLDELKQAILKKAFNGEL